MAKAKTEPPKSDASAAAPAWRIKPGTGWINRNGTLYAENDLIPLEDEEAAALAELIEPAE